MELYKIICSTNWNRLGHLKLWTKFQEWNKTEISCCTVCLSILIKFSRYFRGTHRLNTLGCRLTFWSAPPNFSLLNSDSFRMSSAFKSTIYENSRIHDNQVHAYEHVHGRWKTKQRITLIPKLRSDRKLFWPPFCSCLCFRCLVRCILVASTNLFLVPGSRERPGEMVEAFLQVFQPLCKAKGRTVIFLTRVSENSHANIFYIYIYAAPATNNFSGVFVFLQTLFFTCILYSLCKQFIPNFSLPPPSPVKK